MNEIKEQVREAGEEGRRRRRHELALAMLLVTELEDKFNGNLDEPPVHVPPPWRPQQSWNRRSAFRRKGK